MPIYKTKKKNKEGKYQYRVCVNYTDLHGNYKQKNKYVYGSAEAKEAESKLLISIQQGENASKKTVQALFDEYISVKKLEVRETSLAKTQSILRREVLPKFKNVAIDKLTVPILQEWKTEINDKNLSLTTKRNIYGEFRALINYAVRMEYIPRNMLNLVGGFKEVYFEKPQDKIQFYTAEQFQRFIKQAKEQATSLSGWGYYVFFCIAFYTGMRKGEINALKWSDIEGNIIHIRRSVAQKVNGKSIIETPPKNKTSYRDIQMPQQLIKILDQHQALHRKQKGYTDNYRVCGGVSCISDTALSNKNKEFAKLAGLEPIRIHDFRHSHASLLVNNSINIQEVAKRLGHSKVEITWNTYSHLYPKEEERALAVLESVKI
ncbi:MAG: site-specific integrase [Clostridia bacterium]|nr:site-specific integrase [Clostridia bacterium]